MMTVQTWTMLIPPRSVERMMRHILVRTSNQLLRTSERWLNPNIFIGRPSSNWRHERLEYLLQQKRRQLSAIVEGTAPWITGALLNDGKRSDYWFRRTLAEKITQRYLKQRRSPDEMRRVWRLVPSHAVL